MATPKIISPLSAPHANIPGSIPTQNRAVTVAITMANVIAMAPTTLGRVGSTNATVAPTPANAAHPVKRMSAKTEAQEEGWHAINDMNSRQWRDHRVTALLQGNRKHAEAVIGPAAETFGSEFFKGVARRQPRQAP
jgi:hypothetical protein